MANVNPECSDSLHPEEEPKLKYRRMLNDFSKITLNEEVSCIAVHPKFICIGTRWGGVYWIDHEGFTPTIGYSTNTAGTTDTSSNEKVKALHSHSVAVNHISIDDKGDYIASCSDDGRVIIHGLHATENNHNLSLSTVIKCVALDPNYYKPGSGRRFLIGDNKLTLCEKSILNRIKSTVLSEREGYVQAIAWQDRFVALASDVGVRVYDLIPHCSLGLIKWERNKTVSIEKFRCNLIWSADKTLMIGWVDTIRICVIRKRTSLDLQTRMAPEYLVDPMYVYQMEYYISGLAPLENQLVTLGFPKEPDPKTGQVQRPTLYIVDYKECEFTEVSSDTLNIKGYEEYSWNDYHLASVIEENMFFIVSPKGIIVASQYDINDKVQWLVDHDLYDRAMMVLENSTGMLKHTLSSVRILYMDHLLSNNDFEQAAIQCSKVCSADLSLWEEQIPKFANANRLRSISQYLPKLVNKKAWRHVYEMVLQEYLIFDPKGFLRLVKEWDPTQYNTDRAVNAVLAQLLCTTVDMNSCMEALAVLYSHQMKYDKALSMYLKLQHKDVFDLIEKYKLHNFIHDKILKLMNLDEDKTIAILMDYNKVAMEVVEEQFKSNVLYFYKYLHAMRKFECSGKYHGKLVELYAQFSREELLPFLKFSDKYPIEDALKLCQEKHFYHEVVFILSRIGTTKEALHIIITKLKDINEAITFCQEQNDKELWMDLINHSLDKPVFISLLLKRIGNYVDPRVLISGIKPGCEIDDLKDSLAKMMGDYYLQLSVLEACRRITLRNYFDLHEKLVSSHQRGIRISDECVCSKCHERIVIKDMSDMKVYNCKHSFHTDCNNIKDINVCEICNPVKQ